MNSDNISYNAANRLIRTASLTVSMQGKLTEEELIRTQCYVYGELSPTETEAFEKRLAESPALQEYTRGLQKIEDDFQFVKERMKWFRERRNQDRS